MSTGYENVKKRFLDADDLIYKKEFLSQEENERISEEYLSGDSDVKDKILEVYDFDYDIKYYTYRFYKLIPTNITDNEINQYILIKLLENVRLMDQKLGTIKFIMLFWFILTVIGMALFILGAFA